MRQFDNVFVKRFGYFNVFVIRGNDGDVVIDTGFILMKRSLKRWLDQFNVKLIILTHAHVDHIWNVKYLKDLYGCRVAISEDDLVNLDNRNIKTYPSCKRCRLWTKLMSFGMKHFVPEKFDVDLLLHDGDILKEYGLKLKIISLSGHTDGSIGILYEKDSSVGDDAFTLYFPVRIKSPFILYSSFKDRLCSKEIFVISLIILINAIEIISSHHFFISKIIFTSSIHKRTIRDLYNNCNSNNKHYRHGY